MTLPYRIVSYLKTADRLAIRHQHRRRFRTPQRLTCLERGEGTRPRAGVVHPVQNDGVVPAFFQGLEEERVGLRRRQEAYLVRGGYGGGGGVRRSFEAAVAKRARCVAASNPLVKCLGILSSNMHMEVHRLSTGRCDWHRKERRRSTQQRSRGWDWCTVVSGDRVANVRLRRCRLQQRGCVAVSSKTMP